MVNQNFVEEEKLFDFSAISDTLLRRRKIIIFSTSVLFSLFAINTINNFFKNPVYQGSFTILIKDPIDSVKQGNPSIEERLAANNPISELPTLIQYLKSEYVLRPLAEELGISIWGLRNKLNIILAGDKPYVARGILEVSLRGKNKLKTQITLEKLSKRFVDAAKEQRQLSLKAGLDFLDSEFPEIDKKTKLIKSKIEQFRKKYNLVNPILQAEISERQQSKLKFSIKEMNSNITRLNDIKRNISSNKISIEPFTQELEDLGIVSSSYNIRLVGQFRALQNDLSNAKTKYHNDSTIVKNLTNRINILSPRIKEKQIEAIDLAIQVNQRNIKIAEESLEVVESDFGIQPEILNQYESLERELQLSLENLNSLIRAKENYQLQIAQKSLPWRVINEAIVSATPISPNVKEGLIKNLLFALAISFGLAFLKENTEKGFTSEGQIEKIANLFGIPILGSIPFIQKISKLSPLIPDNNDFQNLGDELSGNRFMCSESFRSLVTSIRFLNLRDNDVNSIMITSSKPSEGKTTITSLVAKTLADLGNKVLLVDGDMRRPAIHKFFKIDNLQGLSNLITDSKIQLDEVIIKTPIPNLEIITAGISPPDPVYLLSSNQMRKVYKKINEMPYEYIIFDAPPSETLADADVLSQYTNLNLFVVSLDRVERNTAKKVINKLSKISNGQNGLVINYLKEEDNLLSNYGYQYKYNNEIYKYYNKKDDKNPTEDKDDDKRKFNLQFSKKMLKKYFLSFKKWIDF